MTLPPSPRSTRRVPLGQVVVTTALWGVLSAACGHEEALCLLADVLDRHRHADWGVVSDSDAVCNDEALTTGGRLLSAYNLDGTMVWCITEADRQTTTLLRPEDY